MIGDQVMTRIYSVVRESRKVLRGLFDNRRNISEPAKLVVGSQVQHLLVYREEKSVQRIRRVQPPTESA